MNFTINKNKFTLFRSLSLFFAAALLITAVISIKENMDPYNSIMGNITFFTLNLIVILILFYVEKKIFKYDRKAFISWTFISLSQVATIFGNILWTIMYTELNKSPFPSIIDIPYLLYYPLLIIGILYLPVTRTKETKKYQILLDTGIMIIAAGLVIWAILISFPMVHSANTFNMLIYLCYMLMDVFTLFILFYLLFDWFGQVKKAPLLLLALSVAVLVITNAIYIYQFLYTVYISGNYLNIGWLSSYFLTALAGISYINNQSTSSLPRLKYKFSFQKIKWNFYLPILWISFIYTLLYWIHTQSTDNNLNIFVGGAAVILTMLFIRQMWDLKDSNHARELLQKNQEILEKREKHLRLITDNMMDLITRIDANGNYLYISPSAYKVLGYTPDNMMKHNVMDLVHPNDLEKLKSYAQEAVKTHSPLELEYRHKISSGDYAWVETASTPIFDDENNFRGFVCGSKNINYRKNVEEQIKTSLEEKEVLLKEIHHRVKNNMQIISSLLSLQSKYIQDENYLAIFKESQDRVKSMAMIHEGLYKSDNLARINFEEYTHNLISGLFSSYGVDENIIKTKINLDNILLDVDTAIPLGLILNELITNSLKHAFPEHTPHSKNAVLADPVKSMDTTNSQFNYFEEIKRELSVSISQNNDILKMVVCDNGMGLPENIDFRNTKSLGLQLVNALVDQLMGEIELEKDNGTKFIINLKM